MYVHACVCDHVHFVCAHAVVRVRVECVRMVCVCVLLSAIVCMYACYAVLCVYVCVCMCVCVCVCVFVSSN